MHTDYTGEKLQYHPVRDAFCLFSKGEMRKKKLLLLYMCSSIHFDMQSTGSTWFFAVYRHLKQLWRPKSKKFFWTYDHLWPFAQVVCLLSCEQLN